MWQKFKAKFFAWLSDFQPVDGVADIIGRADYDIWQSVKDGKYRKK